MWVFPETCVDQSVPRSTEILIQVVTVCRRDKLLPKKIVKIFCETAIYFILGNFHYLEEMKKPFKTKLIIRN